MIYQFDIDLILPSFFQKAREFATELSECNLDPEQDKHKSLTGMQSVQFSVLLR